MALSYMKKIILADGVVGDFLQHFEITAPNTNTKFFLSVNSEKAESFSPKLKAKYWKIIANQRDL